MNPADAAPGPIATTPENHCCSLGSGPLSAQQAERYATLLKVLAEPTRLQILSRLAAEGCEPMGVAAITGFTGLSQPTVSHHLKRLADVGLIEKIPVGREVKHTVVPELFTELRTVLDMGP